MKLGKYILSRKESKKLISEIFSIYKIDYDFDFDNYVFIRTNKDRVYLVRRSAFDFPLEKLRIDSMGLYFATIEKDGIRLSIEGSQMFGKYSKNLIEIENPIEWMRGNDIEIESKDVSYVIVKHKDDYLGSGKLTGRKLLNYIPKVRRIN